MHSPMPKLAHVYGDTVSRNAPTFPTVSTATYAPKVVGAYVEGFTLALEEHVWSSLATARNAEWMTYTAQPHQAQPSRRRYRK
jgi:hypothetical protein